VAPLLLASWLGNAAWVLAWAALGGVSILLVVLLRTRWSGWKPWKKCAVLSLWVHVLLACLTAMVRIASSGPGYGPGYGPGESIRVSILPAEYAARATDAETEVDVAAEAIVEPPAEPLPVEAPADDAEQAIADEPPPEDPASDFEAPTLLAEPTPAEPTEPAPAIESPTAAPFVAAAPAEPAPSAILPPDASPTLGALLPPEPLVDNPSASALLVDAAASATTSAAAPPASPPAPPRPAAYAQRFGAERAQLVASGGGNGQTEAAVDAALAWLAAAQEADGRWDARRHGAGREVYAVLGQDRGATGAKADAGVSGLALLALLGAGHTPSDGDYAEHVERGLDYLARLQRPNGDLGGDAEFFARMYCHSMATFAAGEAYALTKDESLHPLAARGASYSLAAQHAVDGGWRYLPNQPGDTSQLGWQLMALKSAQAGGVDVPAVTWTRMERFLRNVSRGHAGGLAAYQPVGAPTRSMTAEALYCRQLLTGRADGGLDPAALDEAIDAMLKETPSPKQVNLYYWYYATLALHQAQHASPESAAAWRRWNDALTETLVATQNSDGSWPAGCVWGGYGGRVYTTSLACMCLEVYYRYAPPAAEADVARRGGWHAAPR
jgi:hypothetical protein